MRVSRAACRSAAPALLAAFLLGALSVLAFAPWRAFWLLPLALAALFRLADRKRPAGAALLGLAYGIGQFGFGTYWIFIALSGVGGAPWPLAIALLAGLIIVLGAFIAATLGAAVWASPTPGIVRDLLWLPALWTLVEWLRSWIFSGFPWLSIGYSQINSPLVGIAPILGVFGVSWALATTAGLLAWASRNPRRAPWAACGLAALWVAAYGASRIHWTHPSGPSRTVALVQGDIPQQAKWSQKEVDQAVRRYSQLTSGHWNAWLIVWPETAIPDYYRDVKPALDNLGNQLAGHGSTLITGLLHAVDSRHAIYNSAVAVGAGHGLYAKRHLVPFGEYFPVPRFVRRWMAAAGMPYANFTAGAAHQTPIVADGVTLGISICYEDIFGPLVARDVPPAAVLVNVSDDAWFGQSIGPRQHFEMARMRAVETGRYLVRADNSAVTGIVAPSGRVTTRAPGFVATAISGRIRPYSGRTPFDYWDNRALVGLASLLAALAALIQRRTQAGL